ncbi:MAG: glycosyltransferase family 4 protein [Adhaeribacter sp.]
MNILLSAYSVHPHAGSESGVAWRFIKELAKDHTLFILTRKRNKPDIEAALAGLDLKSRLSFFYFDLPILCKLYKVASVSEHLYYCLWQLFMPLKARRVVKEYGIDLIHHVTLGAFRYPSLLAFFNKPFIFGPVGGGENYPFTIKKAFPYKFVLLEVLRDMINKLFLLNPLLLWTFHKSTLIVCRTSQTLGLIPKRYHHKCIVEIGICVPEHDHRGPGGAGLREGPAPLRMLYAGRPVYWKGLHFVIAAYARVLQKYPDTEFHVSGPGDPAWAKTVAARHGVLHKINWLGKVDKARLEDLYQTSDLLAFPSLREAGGAVAIEALSYSLPVLCLDLGGPAQVVNSKWGIVVPTRNKTQLDLIQDIADEISGLYQAPDKLRRMRENTREEAGKYAMDRIVARIYQNPLVVAAQAKYLIN